ncbi:MAG TPA: class F sortase [Candidatus Saccharimonadales bacterium]|nr:class F sortase [Candidatus Saccharimonadales bacterium]
MSLKTDSQYLTYGKPVHDRLPAAGSRRRPKRAVRAAINLGRHELAISCRRFTTPPHRRSRRFSQVVIATPVLPFREVAISLRSKARKKRSRAKLMTAWLLMLAGLISAGYFVAHLETRPDLSLPAKAAPVTSEQAVPAKATTLGSRIKRQEKLNLVKPVPAAAPKPKPAPPPVPKVMKRSAPLSISIPRIQLEASVFQEGLRTDGTISMPNVFDRVGWYDKSPTPGERGPAVLTGHVDSTEGIAVFWRLRELKIGDLIKVGRQDGSTATFRVTNVGQFPQDKFPTQAVYGPIDHAGIRLITCGGSFNAATGHYDHNTVVYGRLQT